jgi:hypothetical protein
MMKLVEGKVRLIKHPEIILYITKIIPDDLVYGHKCCIFIH